MGTSCHSPMDENGHSSNILPDNSIIVFNMNVLPGPFYTL